MPFLYVDSQGAAPYAEIQDAVDDAQDGDHVLVFAGSYGPISFSGKEISVRAVEGPALTIIDGSSAADAAVVFDGEEGPGALLFGFTVTGGAGHYEETVLSTVGGGIFVGRAAAPRISGNVVSGNSAERGGGIGAVTSAPEIYGNVVTGNSASVSGGGLWAHGAPPGGGTLLLACDEFLGNSAPGAGGVHLGTVDVALRNSIFDGNGGERGGLWVTASATGLVQNNTFAANDSSSALGASAIETESADVDFSGNLVASNLAGWGVLRSVPTGDWSYNDVFGNGGGNYGGAAGDPTGSNGNISFPPVFQSFTTTDATDDDLALMAASPLLELGDPAAEQADLDGSVNAIGFQGGPHAGCDLDGDGVRPDEGDCRAEEGAFFPGAYETGLGLDLDCDGWASLVVLDLVHSDGALVSDASAVWEFGTPSDLPGQGVQGTSAWCTGCGADPPPSSDATLLWTADLSGAAAGAETRLQLTHAWDDDATQDACIAQAWDAAAGPPAWVQLEPDAGYPAALDPGAAGNAIAAAAAAAALGTWAGQSDGWVVDLLDVSAFSGNAGQDLRLWFASSSASPTAGPGHAVGRLALLVEDADGDGRGAGSADCDDGDASIYAAATETPYDGIDQDCDGGDLVDADGDGFDGVPAGGDDCDDGDPLAHPGAAEVAYDGIDQDCDGGDADDLDGDGFVAEEAGGDDCDDADEGVHPDAEETPYDGVDQDCDGDDLVDVDGDGVAGNVAAPFGDCDDGDPAVHPGAAEDCSNGVDDDCDGAVDLLPDGDADGWDVCAGDCADLDPAVHPGAAEICDGVDTDCDGSLPFDEIDADGDGQPPCGGDCADGDPAVLAGAADVCDGLDNDCDGEVDDGHDQDGDGFSSCDDDCDDQRSAVHPGAAAICEGGLDADCSGEPDWQEEACAGTEPGGCACSSSLSGRKLDGFPALLALIVSAGRRRRAPRD